MFVTREGRPQAVVLLGVEATWIERHAAEELQKYLQAMSGAELPIVTDPGDAAAVIAIGRAETNPLIADLCRHGQLELSAESPGLDGFVIQTVAAGPREALVLGGSADRSALFAVYSLLEDVLGVGFFRDGERIPRRPTVELPRLSVRERPRFAGREEGSGCMFVYSAMCWSWEDWQREIDWRVKRRANTTYPFFTLNGCIVREVMREWGVTHDGVAVAGPVTDDAQLTGYVRFHERALDYARKVGLRMPCDVPLAPVTDALVEKFPEARIIVSDWADFAPTRSLHPSDPLFRRFVVDFVRHYSARYGNDHVFAGGFLSESRMLEGGDRHQAWLAYAKAMSEALLEADPQATWVVSTWPLDLDPSVPGQGWTMDQVHEYLNAITMPMIVSDLWAEEAEKYKRADYFRGKPWGFSVLHSFGGHTYLHGDVHDLVERLHEIERRPEGRNCVYFADGAEIIDFNGFYLELCSQLAWDPAPVTVEGFIKRYCHLRYGEDGARVFEQVFPLLVETVYGPNSGSIAKLLDPLYWFRLTPDLYIGSAADRDEVLELRRQRLAYIPKLRQALELLVSQWAALEDNDLASRDLVDIARQWIAERFNRDIRRALEAFEQGDAEAFERWAAVSLNLLDQQARLLATWPAYRLDVKVERAKAIYGDDAGRAVKHAHLWVYPEADMETAGLRDYYRMDLDVLVRDYYRARVAAYLAVLRQKLAAGERAVTKEELDAPYAEIETAFVAAPLPPPPDPEKPVAVVRDLLGADR